MTTPVITDFPLPFPAKGQSDTDFNNNVDAYLSWLSGTNVSELQIALPWVQARLEEVAATALSGTLPDISAQSGKSLIVNYLGTAVAFAPLSGRNLIINGSGRVNQRGYVSGAATAVANQFTLDRWFVVTSGQNLTFTSAASGRTMTAPAGGVSQVIESANIVGGTYVINWTGTATATVNGVSRAKGATFTLTANTNATVRFAGGTYTDAQIELGTIATAFERMDFGTELINCQRYYQVCNAEFRHGGSLGGLTVSVGHTWVLQVATRAVPTVAVLSEYSLNASAISSVTALPSTGILAIWAWTSGTSVISRTKAAILSATSELTA